MTEESRQLLLDYFIGKIQPNVPVNKEIFKEQEMIDRSNWSKFFPKFWKNFCFEGMVAGNEQTSNLTVLYGGYLDQDNNSHGIIILVNESFEPVKVIYNYNSGAELRYIQYMKQAEDGTFYFIDDTAFTMSQTEQVPTSQKRFVMTNNFTLVNQLTNDYEIILRTSYILNGDYQNFYCKSMYKDPNSSHYIFFGSGVDTTSSYLPYKLLKIFDLEIKVGEANKWTSYATMSNRLFGSAIATFDSDSNVYFRCLSSALKSGSKTIDCISKTYTGSVVTTPIQSFSFTPYIDSNTYKKQSVFLSMDKVYYVQNNQRVGTSGHLEGKYIGLYCYDFVSQVNTTIYEKNLGNYDYCNLEAIYIDRCNTNIYVQYNNNIDNTNFKADYYFQRLIEDKWAPILISEQQYFVNFQRTLYVKSNFNLLQVYLYQTNPRWPSAWFQYLIKENYNPINYNGDGYVNYNSLIPQQCEIYANNKLIFARNLYNKTINDNITISTVEIPNTYLNGIIMDSKILQSKTNIDIIADKKTFEKNVYETVYLNFINNIGIATRHENDTAINYILNQEASNLLNNSINNPTDYNQIRFTKARLNYMDGTNKIIRVSVKKIVKENYEVTINFNVPKKILTVEWISEDEKNIYSINDVSNCEIGKTYSLRQVVRKGDDLNGINYVR